MQISFVLSDHTTRKGLNSIYILVWFGRCHKRKINTGVKIKKACWNSTKQVIENHPSAFFLNRQISQKRLELENLIAGKLKPDEPFGPKDLDRLLYAAKNPESTSPDFIAYMFKSMQNSPQLKEATIQNQYKTYIRLKNYYGILPFDTISYNLLRDFNARCIKDGLAQNTISCQHKNIKAMLNRARVEGVYTYPEQKWPYLNFKFPKIKGNRDCLTKQELATLEAAKLPDHLDIARRMFLFICYTGLRISDFVRIKSDMLDADGVLHVIPQKTETTSSAKVMLPLKTLFAGKPYHLWESFNFQFPTLDANFGERFNYALKQIALAVGIKKHITAHVGRHTFLTQLASVSGNVFTVMLMGGIKSMDTALVYVHLAQDLQSLDNVNWG